MMRAKSIWWLCAGALLVTPLAPIGDAAPALAQFWKLPWETDERPRPRQRPRAPAQPGYGQNFNNQGFSDGRPPICLQLEQRLAQEANRGGLARHRLPEIEQGIRLANREILNSRITELNRDSILAFAVTVGRLRARYLEAAFKLGVSESGDPPDRTEIAELKTRREMFEEARDAFEALSVAIERGYVNLKQD